MAGLVPGLVPASHAAPPQRRGRHRRDHQQRLIEQGSPAESRASRSFDARNHVDGRDKPGRRRPLLPPRVLSAQPTVRRQEEPKMDPHRGRTRSQMSLRRRGFVSIQSHYWAIPFDFSPNLAHFDRVNDRPGQLIASASKSALTAVGPPLRKRAKRHKSATGPLQLGCKG